MLWSKKNQLAFPIKPRRRNRRIGEPIKGDIVENVVTRKAFPLSGEDTRNKLVALGVVIQHPRRQPDGGIGQRIQGLRAVRHLAGIADAMLVEEIQLAISALFV